jgi:hypothetical protein
MFGFKKIGMASVKQIVCGVGLIIIIMGSLLVSALTHYRRYEVPGSPLVIIAGLILWIWMVIDFIKTRKKIRNGLVWGIALVLGNWIAALFYFIFIYFRNRRTLDATLKWRFGHPKLVSGAAIVVSAVCITILHWFIMSHVYLSIGIPFPNLYILIVNKIIYAPLTLVLKFAYSLAGIDTTTPPSDTIRIIAHTANFIYTTILYMLVFSVAWRLRWFNGRNAEPNTTQRTGSISASTSR